MCNLVMPGLVLQQMVVLLTGQMRGAGDACLQAVCAVHSAALCVQAVSVCAVGLQCILLKAEPHGAAASCSDGGSSISNLGPHTARPLTQHYRVDKWHAETLQKTSGRGMLLSKPVFFSRHWQRLMKKTLLQKQKHLVCVL